MATKTKTTETDVDVFGFLNAFADSEQKKQDSIRLIELMQKWSGFKPKMWGPTMIGFGSYHYKYASGREGDAPLIGFSPRKANLALYITSDFDRYGALMDRLGKFTTGKACLYVKRLSDVDEATLRELVRQSVVDMRDTSECDALA